MAAGDPGQGAAGAGEPRPLPRRRPDRRAGGRPLPRRHQPRPGGPGGGGGLPARPLPPPRRLRGEAAAAARAAGGDPLARRPLLPPRGGEGGRREPRITRAALPSWSSTPGRATSASSRTRSPRRPSSWSPASRSTSTISPPRVRQEPAVSRALTLDETVRRAEREAFAVALAAAEGDAARAMELLGVSRTTYYRKLKELGLGEKRRIGVARSRIRDSKPGPRRPPVPDPGPPFPPFFFVFIYLDPGNLLAL